MSDSCCYCRLRYHSYNLHSQIVGVLYQQQFSKDIPQHHLTIPPSQRILTLSSTIWQIDIMFFSLAKETLKLPLLSCSIRIRSTHDEVELHEGFSCLIPAAIADYDIVPITSTAKLLESYINNSSQKTFRSIISQFLHLSGF